MSIRSKRDYQDLQNLPDERTTIRYDGYRIQGWEPTVVRDKHTRRRRFLPAKKHIPPVPIIVGVDKIGIAEHPEIEDEKKKKRRTTTKQGEEGYQYPEDVDELPAQKKRHAYLRYIPYDELAEYQRVRRQGEFQEWDWKKSNFEVCGCCKKKVPTRKTESGRIVPLWPPDKFYPLDSESDFDLCGCPEPDEEPTKEVGLKASAFDVLDSSTTSISSSSSSGEECQNVCRTEPKEEPQEPEEPEEPCDICGQAPSPPRRHERSCCRVKYSKRSQQIKHTCLQERPRLVSWSSREQLNCESSRENVYKRSCGRRVQSESQSSDSRQICKNVPRSASCYQDKSRSTLRQSSTFRDGQSACQSQNQKTGKSFNRTPESRNSKRQSRPPQKSGGCCNNRKKAGKRSARADLQKRSRKDHRRTLSTRCCNDGQASALLNSSCRQPSTCREGVSRRTRARKRR